MCFVTLVLLVKFRRLRWPGGWPQWPPRCTHFACLPSGSLLQWVGPIFSPVWFFVYRKFVNSNWIGFAIQTQWGKKAAKTIRNDTAGTLTLHMTHECGSVAHTPTQTHPGPSWLFTGLWVSWPTRSTLHSSRSITLSQQVTSQGMPFNFHSQISVIR